MRKGTKPLSPAAASTEGTSDTTTPLTRAVSRLSFPESASGPGCHVTMNSTVLKTKQEICNCIIKLNKIVTILFRDNALQRRMFCCDESKWLWQLVHAGDQVLKTSVTFHNAAVAGAYAGHRALHLGAHVWSIRQRTVDFC